MAAGKYEEWLEPDGLLRLEAWARNGLTMEQIAHNCGCSLSTLKDWRGKYPAILAALKKGRDVADIEVENALHKKALGYTIKLQKIYKLKRVDYSEETGKRIREVEELVEGYEDMHVPADTTAQIYWLKNRRPETWRDRPAAEEEGEATVRVVFDKGFEESAG
ncbi:MAG: hypothetical protein RR521_06775 [Clostridia bacterium]